MALCNVLWHMFSVAVFVKCGDGIAFGFSALLWTGVPALCVTRWSDSHAELCKSHELWFFHLFAGLPPGSFVLWLVRLLAFSHLARLPPGWFTPWLVLPLAYSSPGLFAPCAWLIHPLACSPSGWFAPPLCWIYQWFIIEASVSIYRKATNKCSVTSLINSYFN